MLKLSFILPCYNVERYIADCLDSIYAQDMSEDEYEVICVNDCSTDGTRDIIREFASKHPNLSLIDHERNMTVGGARNTGLSAAKGEYVWFVDADDMIVPKTRELFQIVEVRQLDILLFNFEKVYQDRTHKKYEKVFSCSEVLTGEEFIDKYFPMQIAKLGIVWRCLFKRGFIVNNGLFFPMIIKGEDAVFVYKALLCSKRVSSISDIYYVYRGNPFSSEEARMLTAKRVFHERILFGNEISGILSHFEILSATVLRDLQQTIRWCVNEDIPLIKAINRDERRVYYGLLMNNNEMLRSMSSYMSKRSEIIHCRTCGYLIWYWFVKLSDWLFSK